MFWFSLFFLLAWFVGPSPALADDEIRIKRSIAYTEENKGGRLLADVYLPSTDEPHPTLLMIHGGAWFSGNKANVAYHASFAAEHGYAVVAINYRLAPRHKFPAQVEDCRKALTWIHENADEYQFDKQRIGVYGYSAGAHLASLVGLSSNNSTIEADADDVPKIRAIVAGGTPCEFSWIPDESKALAYWLGDSREAVPKAYVSASPIEFVDRNDPPVFLFHGTADRIVPVLSPEKLKQELDDAEIKNELHLVDDASHMEAFINKTARKKAIQFLDQYLSPMSERTSE